MLVGFGRVYRAPHSDSDYELAQSSTLYLSSDYLLYISKGLGELNFVDFYDFDLLVTSHKILSTSLIVNLPPSQSMESHCIRSTVNLDGYFTLPLTAVLALIRCNKAVDAVVLYIRSWSVALSKQINYQVCMLTLSELTDWLAAVVVF